MWSSLPVAACALKRDGWRQYDAWHYVKPVSGRFISIELVRIGGRIDCFAIQDDQFSQDAGAVAFGMAPKSDYLRQEEGSCLP